MFPPATEQLERIRDGVAEILPEAELIAKLERSRSLGTPLVVVSERTAKAAEEIGFDRVELADRASDAAILDALCRLV